MVICCQDVKTNSIIQMYLCILQIGLNMKHVKSVPKIVHIEFFCYLLSNICFFADHASPDQTARL